MQGIGQTSKYPANIGLFIGLIFLTASFWPAPTMAQVSCSPGTPGLGGPNVPDLDSDGCVDETDLSMLMSCFRVPPYTPATMPAGCIVSANPTFSVGITPPSPSIMPSESVSFTVTATGRNGIPAGSVSFTPVCPPTATCSLSAPTCPLPADGSCSVTLDLTNTDSMTVGIASIRVMADHPAGDDSIATASLTVTPRPNIFVTSGTHNGDLYAWSQNFIGCSGIALGNENANEYANCICTRYAQGSSIMEPGEYHAWLSHINVDSGQCGPGGSTAFNANVNISSADNQGIPFVRADGVRVADTRAVFSTGSIQNPINRDENGNAVTGYVWTGTEADGTCDASGLNTDCRPNTQPPYTRWTEQTNAEHGLYGNTQSTNYAWTVQSLDTLGYNNSLATCNNTKRLYCMWYDSDIPADWSGGMDQ